MIPFVTQNPGLPACCTVQRHPIGQLRALASPPPPPRGKSCFTMNWRWEAAQCLGSMTRWSCGRLHWGVSAGYPLGTGPGQAGRHRGQGLPDRAWGVPAFCLELSRQVARSPNSPRPHWLVSKEAKVRAHTCPKSPSPQGCPEDWVRGTGTEREPTTLSPPCRRHVGGEWRVL